MPKNKELEKLQELLDEKDRQIDNMQDEIDDLESEVSDLQCQPEPVDLYRHMHRQPFSCRCSKCRCDLEIKTTLDRDGDINIVVTPCRCQTTEKGAK